GLSVTNPVSSASATPVSVTLSKTSRCGTITPNITFFPYYNGPTSHCTPGSPCATGENISFAANITLGYDMSCSAHSFTWDFGDSSAAGSGQNVTHSFSA